jgi:uncharacterized protein involved in cysteine biosynthesis
MKNAQASKKTCKFVYDQKISICKIMLNSYFLAFAQLRDPRILKPLLWSSLLSIVSLVILLILGTNSVDWLFESLSESSTSWMGDWGEWIKTASKFLLCFFLLAIAYFFLGSVHAAYLGLFLDGIVDAVRDKNYPKIDLNSPPPIMRSTVSSIRFVFTSLSVNFIASPLYLLGWFFPPTGLILQIWINGWLLGKEYGHLIEERIPTAHRASKKPYTRFGMLAGTLWMVPIVNFTAPVLLCAAIMHDRMKKHEKETSSPD